MQNIINNVTTKLSPDEMNEKSPYFSDSPYWLNEAFNQAIRHIAYMNMRQHKNALALLPEFDLQVFWF